VCIYVRRDVGDVQCDEPSCTCRRPRRRHRNVGRRTAVRRRQSLPAAEETVVLQRRRRCRRLSPHVDQFAIQLPSTARHCQLYRSLTSTAVSIVSLRTASSLRVCITRVHCSVRRDRLRLMQQHHRIFGMPRPIYTVYVSVLMPVLSHVSVSFAVYA